MSAGSADPTLRFRIVLVGTGTGIGKTHVACALLACWAKRLDVVGLKPVETGIPSIGRARIGGSARPLGSTRALPRAGAGHRGSGGGLRTGRRGEPPPSDQEQLARAARLFHVKRPGRAGTESPTRSLFAFADPVSPHLAARSSGIRIDLGLVERWVLEHEAPLTVIETAGGLFSPLGHGASNFELMQSLRPHAVILVAPDRLGVLHELTTTLALAAARGGPSMGVVLSTPPKRDASTGSNAGELAALGITRPIATFPRAPFHAAGSAEAASRVIAWIEHGAGRDEE